MKDAKGELNEFVFDTKTRSPRNPLEATMLLSVGEASILNNRQKTNGQGLVIPVPWRQVKNQLIFVESSRGLSYMTFDRTLSALFPTERSGQDKAVIASMGRYLLFRVMNPTEQVRLSLEISTEENHSLPPAELIGEQRVKFQFAGQGSGRTVSPPVRPQQIDGESYICLDMGIDGTPRSFKRKGLMRLWGASIAYDYRHVVGISTDASLITDQEYASFSPPAGIRKFPEDLRNRDLEFSGVHEDGWLSDRAFFVLSHGTGFEPLVIRGLVPSVGDPAFKTTLRVSADGNEFATVQLGVGTFDLRLATPVTNGRQRLDLTFDRVQPLSGDDPRRASALLECIGLGNNFCGEQKKNDIVIPDGQLTRGRNWFPLEQQGAETFRWFANDAEFFVPASPHPDKLVVAIERGPGLGTAPAKLQAVTSAGSVLAEAVVTGRRQLEVPLPAIASAGAQPLVVRLHSTAPGMSVGRDARVLNYRVFHAVLQSAAAGASKAAAVTDIASPDDLVATAKGWYPIETYKGETFRWVNNDAAFIVADPRAGEKGIKLEVEPGPGVDAKPFVLRVLDASGRQVQAAQITGRQTVDIYLPAAAKPLSSYRLHLDGGGKTIAGDPRILNFRVFRLYTSAHGPGAADIVFATPNVTLGANWYPLENAKGETFRWVNNDAAFHVSGGTRALTIEMEPGPGATALPVLLRVMDSTGRTVQTAKLPGRQSVSIILPAANATYRLHMDGGGKPAPGDPRTLNFRVFRMAIAK